MAQDIGLEARLGVGTWMELKQCRTVRGDAATAVTTVGGLDISQNRFSRRRKGRAATKVAQPLI